MGYRPVGLLAFDLYDDLFVKIDGTIKRIGSDSEEKWCYFTS